MRYVKQARNFEFETRAFYTLWDTSAHKRTLYNYWLVTLIDSGERIGHPSSAATYVKYNKIKHKLPNQGTSHTNFI